MERPLISVIVPVYKTERYLPRCIESIVRQTYENLEIILVDDGSPDGCGEICDRYSKADNRILTIHKKNGGVSSARNAGLNAANGKYVLFSDSDDSLKPDIIEKMAAEMQKNDCDLVLCGFIDVDGNRQYERAIDHDYSFKSRADFLDHIGRIHRGILLVFSKLFSMEKIKKYQLRFEESISLGEDSSFCLDYYNIVFRASALKYCGYYYFHRENSISSRVNFPFNGSIYYNHFINFFIKSMSGLDLQKKAKMMLDIFLFTAVSYKIGYEATQNQSFIEKNKKIREILNNPFVKIAYAEPHDINRFTKILLPFYRMRLSAFVLLVYHLKYFTAKQFPHLYKSFKKL